MATTSTISAETLAQVGADLLESADVDGAEIITYQRKYISENMMIVCMIIITSTAFSVF